MLQAGNLDLHNPQHQSPPAYSGGAAGNLKTNSTSER